MSEFKRFPFLIFSILLLLLAAQVSATVTATYTPVSPLKLEMSPGIFTHPNMFGAKLGRLEVTTDQPLYNPTVLVTGVPSDSIVLIGPHRWDTNADFIMDKNINMNVLAVSYPNGPSGSVVIQSVVDKNPLLGAWKGMVATANPFIVDFYLANANAFDGVTDPNMAPTLNTSGGEFKLDSLYSFKNPPFAPYFTVGITDTIDQGPYVFPPTGNPTQGEFIPINENVGQGTTPIVDPSGVTTDPDDGTPGIWHGDDIPGVDPVQFFFSFLSNSVLFDLYDAYGSKRKEVNTASMEVVNGIEGETYKQKITFTDSGTAEGFQLKPANGLSGIPIDFNLYWGSSNNLIPYGVPIDWEDLNPGNDNHKNLWIGGIDENAVAQRLSGSYIDTIFVNITSAD